MAADYHRLAMVCDLLSSLEKDMRDAHGRDLEYFADRVRIIYEELMK